MMLRSIKYELRLNKTQKNAILQTCGCCRLVYNTMLDRKIKAYQANKRSMSSIELINQLVPLKNEKPFLKDVPSQSLQQAIRNLETAYQNFFRNGGSGFPKFKKKGKGDSFRIPIAPKIDFDNWKVQIAKIGWVSIYKGHNKQINGKIKSYTISHTSTDRYYISILFECENKAKLNDNKSVGIDLGIKNFAILSDGKVFENQKHLKSNLSKLRALQRSVSRKYHPNKTKDEQSNNWKKAKLRVAKLQEHIAFQREDFLHKTSRWIADHYSIVCVETLNVKGMMKNHHLAQSIADASWGRFVEMLDYKVDTLVKIDKFFASSQTCFDCGFKHTEVKKLSIREWVCPQCGKKHNRDLNASRNIEREGLSLCGLKVSGYTVLAPRTQRFQTLK